MNRLHVMHGNACHGVHLSSSAGGYPSACAFGQSWLRYDITPECGRGRFELLCNPQSDLLAENAIVWVPDRSFSVDQ